MTKNDLAGWYNYQKEQYEYIDTPTDFTEYIPQNNAAQALYKLYQEMGTSAIEAAIKVLEISAGVK